MDVKGAVTNVKAAIEAGNPAMQVVTETLPPLREEAAGALNKNARKFHV